MSKLPRAIRLLSVHGEAALRPAFDKGKYMKPMVPRRIAANIRNRALREGTYGAFEPELGGWEPAWDNVKKVALLKPYKGHVRERNRAERARKVVTSMEGMPARFEKIAKEVEDRKPKKDISFIFKRVQSLSPVIGSGRRPGR